MLDFLLHWYKMAEVYAVLLVWIVVPLGFFACYLFFQRHYGLFLPMDGNDGPSKNRWNDGSN